MSKSKKLVFFGNERLSTGLSSVGMPTLKALLSESYDITAIVANYSEGKSRNTHQLEIAEVAKRHNIPLLLPSNPLEISEQLSSYKADAAILVAYGKIIPDSIIDIFPRGIINIHPSLLPKYRGSTPIETAILDGVSETGVSIMKLVRRMDAGLVFAQARINLSGNESKQELADKLSSLGAETLIKTLPSILDGSANAKSQDEKRATYSKILKKEDGILDWAKPARQLEREVRAYAGWPRSVTRVFGYKIIVTKAHETNAPAGKEKDEMLIVRANPGWLQIVELIAPSGRTVSGADFVRGYRK